MPAKKIQPMKAWMIAGVWSTGVRFFYHGTWDTRRAAIRYHCAATGVPWEQARKRGDRAVKVVIREATS